MTLKELREEKGLSQEQLAREIGVSFVCYHRLENGKSNLLDAKYRTISGLARVLGKEVFDIAESAAENSDA